MAKFTVEEFINGIKEMTILEINELVTAMEEEFGVNPSAVAVAAPVASEEAEEVSANVDVVLKEVGPNKLAIIKLVREVTGLGLKEAKEIADKCGVVKENVNSDEANELKAKFEEAGASIELK